MLGNGVKRKLAEDELEAGRDHLAVAGSGGPSRASYTLQRQTILNISLMKLYGPRTASEPSLQRRVLISNMIRRIHDELKEEGGLRALFFSVPPATQSAAMEEDEGYHEAPPATFGALSSSPLSGLSPLDSCLTPASLLEDDPPLFFALPPSSPHPSLHPHAPPRPPPLPSPKDSFSSALEEIEELCPTTPMATSATSSSSSPSSSSPLSAPHTAQVPPLPSAGVNMKDGVRGLGPRDGKPSEPLPPSGPDAASASGGFLTDFALDDILFTDIDTSMYDFHPAGSPPNSKLTPVVTTDDLVKTISTFGGGGGSSPSPLSQNQPFKMDLAELDHIMEVLVGS